MKVEENIIQNINIAISEEETTLTKIVEQYKSELSTINSQERTTIIITGGSESSVVAEQTAELGALVSEITKETEIVETELAIQQKAEETIMTTQQTVITSKIEEAVEHHEKITEAQDVIITNKQVITELNVKISQTSSVEEVTKIQEQINTINEVIDQ